MRKGFPCLGLLIVKTQGLARAPSSWGTKLVIRLSVCRDPAAKAEFTSFTCVPIANACAGLYAVGSLPLVENALKLKRLWSRRHVFKCNEAYWWFAGKRDYSPHVIPMSYTPFFPTTPSKESVSRDVRADPFRF